MRKCSWLTFGLIKAHNPEVGFIRSSSWNTRHVLQWFIIPMIGVHISWSVSVAKRNEVCNETRSVSIGVSFIRGCHVGLRFRYFINDLTDSASFRNHITTTTIARSNISLFFSPVHQAPIISRYPSGVIRAIRVARGCHYLLKYLSSTLGFARSIEEVVV